MFIVCVNVTQPTFVAAPIVLSSSFLGQVGRVQDRRQDRNYTNLVLTITASPSIIVHILTCFDLLDACLVRS